MAFHAPSDFDFGYDENALSPGNDIRLTSPTLVVQNQQWAAERTRQLMSAVWCPFAVNAAGWTEVCSLQCYGPNLLGISATAGIEAVFYAWADDAVSTWEVRIDSALYGTQTVTITGAGSDTKQWRGVGAGAFAAVADGTGWTFAIDARRTAGTAIGYVAGVGLFF